MPAFYGDKTNSVRIEGQEYLVAALQSLPEEIAGKYLRGPVKKAIGIVQPALLANTPVGPTGNLRAAVDNRVVYYRANKVAFGVVGYKRAVSVDTTDNKGYHSHLIEFGTADRVARRSPYLSSYRIAKTGYTPSSWTGMWPMRAKRVRGVRAMHPLGKAFLATKSQALAVMLSEMQAGLQKGIDEARRKGL